MKQTGRSRPVAWLVVLRLFGMLGLSACQGCYAGKMETVTIAMVPSEINALVYIAEAQNFFVSNGLQVILKEDYDSGATATAAMLNGEADIASATEFLIARQILNKKDIINFGTVARYENTFIIWRVDSGIKTIEDLKGKRIGVTLQTISAFYLGRTLELHGMNIEQVVLVDIKAAEAEKALVNGEVDAAVTWEPSVSQINQSMGKEITTSALQSGQYAYWNLVGTSDWTNKHPDTISRLMKSLAQAEDYIASHHDEVKAMVGNRMNLDAEYMEIVWPRYQLSLSLDQSLIVAMEDEARWMINNNLTAEKQVPDFLNHIYADGLEAISPNAVNIIR